MDSSNNDIDIGIEKSSNNPQGFIIDDDDEEESNQFEKPNITLEDDNDYDETEEKMHTFRKRRLSYSKKQLLVTLDSDNLQILNNLEESDESTETGEKEKSQSLSSELVASVDNEPCDNNINFIPQDVKIGSNNNNDDNQLLQSRVLHASAPPVPTDCLKRKRNLLYIHQFPNDNDQPSPSSISSPSSPIAEWKKRRHQSSNNEEETLPFPRHIVGTYSCHGIEPLFDEGDDDSNSPSCVAKINQDRGGVAFPYANNARMAIFAAYDGHGEGGEHVAQYALHEVPTRLEQHEEFLKGNIEAAFEDVFVNIDRDLATVKDIEPRYSGCTACVSLVIDKHMYLSNAGDSRAIMACKNIVDGKTVFEALDLTVDHNPDSPGEQERIESMGGFVSPPPEEGLSARVWLDCNYSQIGLAMSRSLGDHAVKSVGVIATPVVTKHEISANDSFMVIATDGVWEFLSSQQVVDLVSNDLESGKGASEACQHLIEAAAAMWHENEGDYRDDITALVVKVQELWDD